MNEKNGRNHLALPAQEMRLLLVLLAAHSDQVMTSPLVAKRAGIVRNPNCVYVVLRRLRRRGLIRTVHFRMRNRDGQNCLFARHELTARGERLAISWRRFLETVGADLRGRIGWQRGAAA